VKRRRWRRTRRIVRPISTGSHRAPGATNPKPNPNPKPKPMPKSNPNPTLVATAHEPGKVIPHAPMRLLRCEHTELGKVALLRLAVDHCAALTAHAAQKLVLLTAKARSSR